MRVAAIYDIHGNLPALEAVLADVRKAGVECLVVGGDVLPGPMPIESLDRLRTFEIPTRYLRGNGEGSVLSQRTGIAPGGVPPQFRETIRWTAEQLRPEDEEWVRSWPATVTLDIPHLGPVLFCHATPNSDTQIFTARTPKAELSARFGGVSESLVVCGHTHMQFDLMVGDIRVVNAGSVGMPFGEPGAYWLLLGPEIDLRRTEYDLEAAAFRIRDTRYPDAEGYAANSVLHPPSVAQMLERFGSA